MASPSPSACHNYGGVWLVSNAPVAVSSEMYKFPTLCPQVKPHPDALQESDREDYRTDLMHMRRDIIQKSRCLARVEHRFSIRLCAQAVNAYVLLQDRCRHPIA